MAFCLFESKMSGDSKKISMDYWIKDESFFTMLNQQLSGANVSLIESEFPVWEEIVQNITAGEVNVYKLDSSPINIVDISDEEISSKTYYDRVLSHIGYFEGHEL